MSKKVLAVGNCYSDHSSIARILREQFDATVERAGGQQDALEALRTGHFDLVLINRKLMGDGSEGLDLIRQIKSNPQLASVPVMLLSDHATYQESALASGAEPGFGKSELDDLSAQERLARFLS